LLGCAVLSPIFRVRASLSVAGVPLAYHMAGPGFAQDMAQGLLATQRTFVLLRCNECQARSVTVAWARPDFRQPARERGAPGQAGNDFKIGSWSHLVKP